MEKVKQENGHGEGEGREIRHENSKGKERRHEESEGKETDMEKMKAFRLARSSH